MKAAWVVCFGSVCFRITTLNGVVNDAPPVASWMLGLPIVQAIQLVHERNGVVRLGELPSDSRAGA